MGMMLSSDSNDVPGLRRAIEEYGPPVERSYVHQVSRDSILYWQAVRKKRVAEVVLLLRRRNGLYLVHTKAFYPKGVYRLLSGGIKPGENLIAAVRREVLEETSLEVRIEDFLGILHHRFVWRIQRLPFVSYLFLVVEKAGVLACRDADEAITGFREVTLGEIRAMANQLESLSPKWADWGRFRATAHRLVGDLLSP